MSKKRGFKLLDPWFDFMLKPWFQFLGLSLGSAFDDLLVNSVNSLTWDDMLEGLVGSLRCKGSSWLAESFEIVGATTGGQNDGELALLGRDIVSRSIAW